jgi:hypothetical protein
MLFGINTPSLLHQLVCLHLLIRLLLDIARSLSLKRIEFTSEMVDCDLHVVVTLSNSVWLVLQLDVAALETIELFSQRVLLDLELFVLLFDLDSFFILPLNLILIFALGIMNVLNHISVAFNFRNKPLFFLFFFHFNLRNKVLLHKLKHIFLSFQILAPLVDRVDFLLDLEHLVVQLFE